MLDIEVLTTLLGNQTDTNLAFGFGTFLTTFRPWRGGGVTLGISGWGCAAGTLGPLTYTRANSAEFCYPILE